MNKKFSKNGSDVKQNSVVPQKKKNLKKAVIIVAVIFAVLAVICLILSAVYSALKDDRESVAESTQNNANLAGKNYINYYNPDYDADIFEDEDYLAKNRTVKYVIPDDSGSVSIILDEYEKSEMTEGQRFFMEYFEAVITGDYESYQEMFAKEYIENPKGLEKHPDSRRFPMQRIYDITIKELGRSDPNDFSYQYNGEPCVFGVYEVSYKILKNDGEFRYDLPEGGEIPVVFELVTTGVGTEDEKTLIRELYKYSDIAD